MAEWLGNGLQNRVQQFESARYLYSTQIGSESTTGSEFFCFCIFVGLLLAFSCIIGSVVLQLPFVEPHLGLGAVEVGVYGVTGIDVESLLSSNCLGLLEFSLCLCQIDGVEQQDALLAGIEGFGAPSAKTVNTRASRSVVGAD